MVTEENELITKIAEESLKLMEDIASTAEYNIHQKNTHQQSSASSLTNINTFKDNSSVQNLDIIKNKNLDNLYKLKEEPIIARITVLNEEEEKEFFYISRVMPISSTYSNITFVSYYAPMGRIASIPVGEEDEITILNKKKSFEVLERITYRPIQTFDKWDSSHTIIQNENMIKTVDSLRAFLSKTLDTEEVEDILSSFFNEEESINNIHEGIKREVIKNMSLRDQPILDEFQDKIFRLSLNDNLLILGSPGTGKTTTLIKRLGQKLNEFNLNEDELNLINNFPTRLSHKNSWLMFTPTELLKHYVKEAFNKEGIPAPENNIKTWSNYRLYLTKQVLDILESATGKSSFIWNDEKSSLKESAFINTIKLYEKFTLFFNQQLIDELKKSNSWLLENHKDSKGKLIEIYQYIEEILSKDDSITINNLGSINRLGKNFSEIIKVYQDDVSKIIISSLNSILNKDKNFLNKLNNFTKTMNISITDEQENEEEEGSDKLSTSKLTKEYNSAIRVYARAKINGTKLNSKSKNAQIIQWLGDRLIDEDKIFDLGIKITTLTNLRKFLNPMKLYISKISSQYKKFRAKKENIEWYNINKESSNILHSLEIDMLLLLTLKNLNSIRATLSENEVKNNFSNFQPLFNEYRNQILVDEATDFSPIQLACMLELSNQKIHSFFACGDFNQRITTFGTQTEEEMQWVSKNLDIREIENPYRQSKILTHLAKLIVNENTDKNMDIANEIAPILIENITDIDKLALWLKARINEIEKMVEFLPSIAIFVNSREEVDSLTEALNKVMVNTPVRGYRDGQSIGNNEEIKIFDIQHIKGLEFEAVFFISIDKLAEEKPLLFDKYLYVGVTRATTYLGITCEKTLPTQIENTRDMFIDKWDN